MQRRASERGGKMNKLKREEKMDIFCKILKKPVHGFNIEIGSKTLSMLINGAEIVFAEGGKLTIVTEFEEEEENFADNKKGTK